MNGIAAREYTQQAVIALGHQDGADAVVAHTPAGISYCRARRERERILVPDDIRYLLMIGPLVAMTGSLVQAGDRLLQPQSVRHEFSNREFPRARQIVSLLPRPPVQR